MLKFIEATGKNEDEAIARGLAQLGLDRDDVSVEILERGKTGFLGIGSVPARVKLTYEVPDEPKPEPVPAPPEPPVVEKKPEPPKPAPTSRPPVQKSRPKPEPKPQPKPESGPRPQPKPEPSPKARPPKDTSADDDVARAIIKFQTGLFEHMGVTATPVVTKDGDAWQVVLEGEDLGALIGHRGETLDAIQQLTGYAVNRDCGHRARIHVDAEGYRARREESLNRLARKTAGKVVKYRRNITLEAMNAYERHVIHTALQDYPGVTTYSTGTEPNRRTVVAYDPSKR